MVVACSISAVCNIAMATTHTPGEDEEREEELQSLSQLAVDALVAMEPYLATTDHTSPASYSPAKVKNSMTSCEAATIVPPVADAFEELHKAVWSVHGQQRAHSLPHLSPPNSGWYVNHGISC